MSDQNQSPFNWYLGTYIVGFELLDVDPADDLHDQFDAWEESVMVKTDSCHQAYDRIIKVGQRDTRYYIGELAGTSVDWFFKGVTELDPVYSDVNETSDVVYVEHNQTLLKDQQVFVCKREEFD